jgi:GH25 family lysozyme M1 (1,4-beta-N-acetylmuramidase)
MVEVMSDVSWYQLPHTIPWAMLKEQYGITRVAVKSSMGGGFDARCDGHCEDVKRDGLKLELYHWIDPIQGWGNQAVYFINKINKHQPDKIDFDIEHWWADWVKYQKDAATCPRLSVAQIRDSARIIWEKVEKETGYGPDRSRGYSACWFIEKYCMELVPFLRTKALWWADYVLARAYVRSMWPEIYYYRKADGTRAPAAKYKLSPEKFEVLQIYLEGNKNKVRVPAGLAQDQVVAWQFDSKIQPEGCSVNIDLSLVFDNEEPEPQPDIVQVELERDVCQVVYDRAGRALGKVLT